MNLDEANLRRRLELLDESKKLAFMLLLCARMMPALRKFAEDTGYDISVYEECLESGWAYLTVGGVGSTVENMSERCFSGAPDTENFNHPLTSQALNAALSISFLMGFLANGNVEHVLDTANMSRETVALGIQATIAVSPLSMSLEAVAHHPLMQRELFHQQDDLNFLESLIVASGFGEAQKIRRRSQQTLSTVLS